MENLKLKEEMMELELQSQRMRDRLGTKADEFEQKVNELSSKIEAHYLEQYNDLEDQRTVNPIFRVFTRVLELHI